MTRYIIVVSAAQVAAAHRAVSKPEMDSGGKGDQTFTVPLSPDGKLPASHYWASWNMLPHQVKAFPSRLKEQGAKDSDVAVIPDKGTPASTDYAVFSEADAGWTPEKVLAALGLQRIVSER